MDRSIYMNLLEPHPMIFFTIVSCLTYRFSFSDEPHQTGIIFNLLTPKTPITNVNPNEAAIINGLAIDSKLGDLQPSDLRTAVWHLGSYAD